MCDLNIETKIKELGLTVPSPPPPVATYVPAKIVDGIIYVSGQGPIINGEKMYEGKVGSDLSLEEAYEAAKLCALNILAQIKAALGNLDYIEEIVTLHGFVASENTFYDQPKVVNGASELLISVFGEKGKHARCAIGVNVLPGNIPVEVEISAKIKKI